MANQIAMNQVLADLQEGRKCTLTYIRSTGTKRGTKKTINNAIEGWNYAAMKDRKPIDHIRSLNASKIRINAMRGLIPIIDLDNNLQLTLLISHMVKYNGHTIIH